MSETPKLKNGDDDCFLEEDEQKIKSKYKWMILIGRLKSLTKIEGRIQVYSTDKNQSELFDGFGFIFTASKIIEYKLYCINLYSIIQGTHDLL